MKIWQTIKTKFCKKEKKNPLIIWRQLFVCFFGLTVISFGLEYFLPGFVTNWLNPVWFLLVLIFSGMIVAFYD